MLGSERIFCIESRFNISFLWEKDISDTQEIWQKKQFSICTQVQVVLVIKSLPTSAGEVRDTGLILGQEDPLGEGMAIHFSILAWRIPWTEEPGGLQSM